MSCLGFDYLPISHILDMFNLLTFTSNPISVPPVPIAIDICITDFVYVLLTKIAFEIPFAYQCVVFKFLFFCFTKLYLFFKMTEVLMADLIEFFPIYRQPLSQFIVQLVINSFSISGGLFLIFCPQRFDYISTLTSKPHPTMKATATIPSSIDKNFSAF